MVWLSVCPILIILFTTLLSWADTVVKIKISIIENRL
jgi:hypothetical protein